MQDPGFVVMLLQDLNDFTINVVLQNINFLLHWGYSKCVNMSHKK